MEVNVEGFLLISENTVLRRQVSIGNGGGGVVFHGFSPVSTASHLFPVFMLVKVSLTQSG